MDPSLIAALLVALATLALYFLYSGGGPKAAGASGSSSSSSSSALLPPSAAHQRAAAQARGAILLCGPPGSGKTTLLHQLLFGAAVRTVPSSQVQALQAPLHHEAAGAPPRRLIDCPGAPRFRSQLLRYDCECAAVLVVVSAAGEAEQVRGAAAALYELYTDAAVVARAPRVLVVASKADAAAALPLPRLRLALERELQRLKGTRSVGQEEGGQSRKEEHFSNTYLIEGARSPKRARRNA